MASAGKKTLVVVESADKGKTLRALLGARFSVKVCALPLMELPRSRLGLDLAHDLAPQHVRSPAALKAAKALREAAADAARVCVAFDPDRRGEAHAAYVASALGKKPPPVERVRCEVLSVAAARAAFATPAGLALGRVDAYHAEQALDRLVTQLVSPVLRSQLRREITVDRVGALGLRMIVERERALGDPTTPRTAAPLDCARVVELAWRTSGLSSGRTLGALRRLYEGVGPRTGRVSLVAWPFEGVVRPVDLAYPPERLRTELEREADGDREQLREVDDAVVVYALVWAADAGAPGGTESARYTDGELLAALGRDRVERDAASLAALEAQGCVVRRDGCLAPTLMGAQASDVLAASFGESLGGAFAAELEAGLARVAAGAEQASPLLARFYAAFEPELRVAVERARALPKSAAPTGATCPRCDAAMVVKWGKNGEFLGCSTYPTCTATQEIERAADGRIVVKAEAATTEKCPTCEKPMVIRRGRYGEFLACSAYPACKTTQPLSLGVACPRTGCGGFLVEKRSRRGQIFYGCASYAKTRCDFVSWDRPVVERCPRCGAGFLVRKEGKRGATLRCIASGCGHTEEVRT